MAGFSKPLNLYLLTLLTSSFLLGLDSLVVSSLDPKTKALLKGLQSQSQTLFIEAVTTTRRALKPGIIFKGKNLQQQWFLQEFQKIADWFFITSPNGWTDNYIAEEWLV